MCYGKNILSSITARNYAVIDGHTGDMILGKKENEKREIASMTKMMTCYLWFSLIDEHEIRMDTVIPVSGIASRLIGTSAKL